MPLSIKEYLKRGPSTSKEIQAATSLSQSSVARRLRELGDNIVQIQDERSIRYAATCNAFLLWPCSKPRPQCCYKYFETGATVSGVNPPRNLLYIFGLKGE